MNSLRLAACTLLGILGAAGLRADPNMFVVPSIGPNAQFSPNGPTYNVNAANAMLQGASSFGTPGTPGYYQGLPNDASLPNTANVVTDFPSWMGNADPGGTFGPAFANELGNRLFFGFGIVRGAADAQFSIADVSFEATSNIPEITTSVPLGGYDYNSRTIGVLFGLDGMLGGGDDIYITSGPNTQLVDAVFGRGTGLALAVLSSSPGVDNQDRLNIFGFSTPNYFIRGTYTLGSFTGDARTFFYAVPEPGTVLGGVAAALCLAATCWRRSRGGLRPKA